MSSKQTRLRNMAFFASLIVAFGMLASAVFADRVIVEHADGTQDIFVPQAGPPVTQPVTQPSDPPPVVVDPPPVVIPPVDPPPVDPPLPNIDFPTPTPQAGDTILEDGTYQARTFSGRTFARNPGKAIIAGGARFKAGAIVTGIRFTGGGADTQDNEKAAVLIDHVQGVFLYDCIIEHANGVGVGIMNADTKVIRCTIQDNGRAGIGGTHVNGGVMYDCNVINNNAKGDGNGGGGKFTRTDRLDIYGHLSDGNYGPGIWFDYNNINVEIKPSKTRLSTFRNNKDFYNSLKLKAGGAGIFFEISGIVDGKGTHGPLILRSVIAYGNRKGISADELKKSLPPGATSEDVNCRSSSYFQILGGRIDQIVVSGGKGVRTEDADDGIGNIIDGVQMKAAVFSDKRFGLDNYAQSNVKITNVKIVP